MKKIIAPICLIFSALSLAAQTCLIDTTTWRATPTADNATIVIPISSMPMLENQALPAGTLIGVFNTNQQLCGVATWTGTANIALTVYGFEAGGRGLTADEAFKFRIKLPDNRMLTNVQATYTAVSGIYTIQGNYVADGIAGLTGLVANYPATLLPNLNIITVLSCYGSSDGILSVTPTGGTAPYRYAWSGGVTSTDPVIRNLNANNYRIEITDNRGCKSIVDTVLRQPDSLHVLDTIQNVRCYGGITGSIRVGAVGGTAPYSYIWQGGSQNLRAGTYNVTVSDMRNCQKVVAYTIRQPDSLRLLDTIQPVRCYGGNDGQIRLGASGGIAPYQFIWQNGNGQNFSVGTYQVVLTDANGCNKAGSYTITQLDSLKLVTTATPSTVGGATGTATVVTTGGTPNYRYVWSQRSDTTAIIRNLAPSTYTVTVTDANGCVKTATISIITNGLRDDLSKNCEIRVYPNPVLNGDKLTFSIRFINVMSQPIHVFFRDALGRPIETGFETIISDVEKTISMEQLPSGIYFMVFQSGNLQTVKAIIK